MRPKYCRESWHPILRRLSVLLPFSVVSSPQSKQSAMKDSRSPNPASIIWQLTIYV